MKRIALMVIFLTCQACSSGTTTAEAQCSSWGGSMVNGQCQKKMAAEDQKKICDKMGLEYSVKYNGCLTS